MTFAISEFLFSGDFIYILKNILELGKQASGVFRIINILIKPLTFLDMALAGQDCGSDVYRIQLCLQFK